MEAKITTIPQSHDVVLSVMDDMFCEPLILSHSDAALGLLLITLTFISIIIIIKIILTRSIIIIQHTVFRTIRLTKKSFDWQQKDAVNGLKLFLIVLWLRSVLSAATDFYSWTINLAKSCCFIINFIRRKIWWSLLMWTEFQAEKKIAKKSIG